MDSNDPAPVNRKRRNRWDDSGESNTAVANEANNSVKNCTCIDDSTSVPPITVATDTDSAVVSNENGDDAMKRARKSRWGSAAQAEPSAPSVSFPGLVSIPVITDEILQQSMLLQLQLQQVNQKLLTVVADALRIEADPNRSPSPPPKYDAQGKRTNTREVRMRESLTKERIELIEKLIKLNPTYQPPPDFVRMKPFRRIYIPKQTDPLVNYIGLIIGPRGMTQKELEAETGCKISIRGKGSAKEGSKGRAAKNIDEDEELHVHVQGDNEEKLALACKKIEEILRPLDESLNEHKQKQLKQLALINGTLKENEYCPVCGEKGHQQFDCPYRAKAFKAAGVKCSICGDLSHPTRDCPMRNEGPANESVIESEYDNFIAELTGGGGGTAGSRPKPSTATNTTDAASTGVTGGSGEAKKTVEGGTILATGPKGQTILAPIVDMFAKKNQTIIHVNTVLTGAAPPPLLATNNGLASASETAALSTNTSTAPTPTAAAASHHSSSAAAWSSAAPLITPAAVPAVPTAPLPTTSVSPTAATAAAAYSAYYPYNAAYAAYYGYDPAAMLVAQQQLQQNAYGMSATPTASVVPVPPVAAGLPGYAPPPPPPPPPPSMGYAPPPPPPPSSA